MKTNVVYSDFLTPEGGKLIESINVILGGSVVMDIKEINKEIVVGQPLVKMLQIKTTDTVTTGTTTFELTKEDVKEYMEIIKDIYKQL